MRLLVFVLVFTLFTLPAHALSLIRDGEVEELLRDWSNPLFIAAGLDPNNIDIYLVDEPHLNAFVAAGQNVFVHTGLLFESETPNMVIGVMAHETGHISAGHLARGSVAANNAGRVALAGAILGLGSLLFGAPDLGLALLQGGQHVALRSYLTHSRAQEAAADTIALELLETTKQSPAGIIRIMDKFAGQEILSETSQDPYARAHPMPRQRVNAYTDGAKKSPYFNATDTEENITRFALVKAKLYAFTQSSAITFRRYAGDNSPPAQYARAIVYHRQGQVEEAISYLDQLIAAAPDYAWFHELKGQVYYENGRAAEGIMPYERALALKPNEPLLLLGLAACQASLASRAGTSETDAQALNKSAEQHLRTALRLDPDNPTLYFQLSRTYGQMERVAYAEWALAEYYSLLKNPDAKHHARRAKEGLNKGTPEYLRASDILEGA